MLRMLERKFEYLLLPEGPHTFPYSQANGFWRASGDGCSTDESMAVGRTANEIQTEDIMNRADKFYTDVPMLEMLAFPISSKEELEARTDQDQFVLLDEGGFHDQSGIGYRDTIVTAGKWKKYDAYAVERCQDGLLYVINDSIKTDKTDPLSGKRTCRLESFFNLESIKLMQAAPRNELTRSLILSKIKQMPPSECDTFEKLRDWIETNISSPPRKPEKTACLNIQYRWSGFESGRCSYRHNVSATDGVSFSLEDVGRLALESDGMEELLERLSSLADDDHPELEESGDIEYSDYDGDEDAPHDVFCDPDNVARAMESLKSYMLENLPQMYADLGGEE